jgi:hypothetical protein
MSDRPTEGPDREALRQQIVAQAHYVLTSPVSPYRRPEERIADAVLALLPTPPAPGGEETREDYWKRRFHEEADAHDRTATDLIAARRGLSAPGGGEGLRATDLRAEVDVLARVLMAAWEKAEGKPVNPSYVATFADMARAALAARDTDQGARDALAEVERLRDDMASTPTIITVSREHVVRRLTAALAARDTDQGAVPKNPFHSERDCRMCPPQEGCNLPPGMAEGDPQNSGSNPTSGESPPRARPAGGRTSN